MQSTSACKAGACIAAAKRCEWCNSMSLFGGEMACQEVHLEGCVLATCIGLSRYHHDALFLW